MNKDFAYETQSAVSTSLHQYFFESVHDLSGRRVVKAIEFSAIGRSFEGKQVYNLGFGDYDPETGTLLDDVLTDNGDQYRVFNTVLNSIRLFYSENPESVLFVAGSDSMPSFADQCKADCRRKCTDACKKRHRRIRTYCAYINRHYERLSREFEFRAGIVDWENARTTDIIDYECGKNYEALLISGKKEYIWGYGGEDGK